MRGKPSWKRRHGTQPLRQASSCPVGHTGMGMIVAGAALGTPLPASPSPRSSSGVGAHRLLFIGTERGIEARSCPPWVSPRDPHRGGDQGSRASQDPGALVKIPGSLRESFRIRRPSGLPWWWRRGYASARRSWQPDSWDPHGHRRAERLSGLTNRILGGLSTGSSLPSAPPSAGSPRTAAR